MVFLLSGNPAPGPADTLVNVVHHVTLVSSECVVGGLELVEGNCLPADGILPAFENLHHVPLSIMMNDDKGI